MMVRPYLSLALGRYAVFTFSNELSDCGNPLVRKQKITLRSAYAPSLSSLIPNKPPLMRTCFLTPTSRHLLRSVERLFRICVITLLLPALGACGQMQHSEKSIVVDREVRFPEFMIVPHAILRTSDSGFVVAGGFGGARAIATSSVGDMLWTYVDDADPTNGVQSEFKSVVQLANGNFLFCGSKTTSDSRQVKHQLSMVTELDQHGKLVESRIGTKPNNNPLYESSDIYQCMRWNEGIAVIGLLFDGVQSQSWLMKLDSNGAKEWDRILPKMPVPWGAETIDHSLVLSTYRTATFESLFTIVNVQGEVMATRSFKNAGFLPLRSAALRKTNSMISYGSGKSTLYTLNDHLSDHEAPKTIPNFIAEEGCGYINADDSITLFGRSTNAAVAWIDASGATIVTRTLDDKRPSFVIDDAVPVSENQFVTVRTTRGASAADQGLAMNWITIK